LLSVLPFDVVFPNALRPAAPGCLTPGFTAALDL
jgi:hypothetical protein